MSKTTKIGGRIESAEQGGIVTGANAIFDDTKGKKQNVINSETDDELARLDNAKQDVLTFDNVPMENSANPVKSGGVYAADAVLQQAIEAILQLIPSAATAMNQLADKAFVNSTVATNTATFRGTYNVVADLSLHYNSTHQEIETALLSVVQTADNNDYCFVQIPVSDSSGDIRVTERYKFNGTAWSYEYDLNNSGFTADQWAAINSTITLALVQKLGALPTAAELAQQLALKQNTLTFDTAPVAGSSNPVKSGGLYNVIAAINATIPSGASVDNKLVSESRLTQYVAAIVNALDATFNVTSTDGHVNVRLTQVDGVITSVEVITNDIASASALSTLAGRVTTNEGNISLLQAAYNALQQSAPVIIQPTDTWPVASPSATVIYRVIDRVNTPPQYYSDYMFSANDLTTPVLMAQYNNAIDDEPTAGSNNLVKSGGVYSQTTKLEDFTGKGTLYNNCINPDTDDWIGSGECVIINLAEYKGYNMLYVVPQNGDTNVLAFLDEINFSEVKYTAGAASCIVLSAGQAVNIPSNANYLYVYKSYASVQHFPSVLEAYMPLSEYIENVDKRTLSVRSLLGVGDMYNNAINVTTWIGHNIGGKCYIIDLGNYINPKMLHVVPNGNSAWIAFLDDVNFNTVDFTDGTAIIEVTNEGDISIPSSANYLYVYYSYGSSNHYPTTLDLTSVLDFKKVEDEVSETKNTANQLKDEQDLSYIRGIERSLIANMDLSQYPVGGNIIVLGDSTIDGYLNDHSVIQQITTTGTVTDISHAGDTISAQITKWDALSADVKSAADIVFCQIGLNDLQDNRDDVTIFGQMQTLIRKIRYDAPNCNLIAGLMLPCHQRFIDVFEDFAEVSYYNWKEINTAIRNKMFIGIDEVAYQHVPILGDEDNNLLPQYESQAGDHIHPNEAGQKVIAWSWLCALGKNMI